MPVVGGEWAKVKTLVVEARLKGAGMHWEQVHVNPMLILRNAVCNRRWQQTWQACVTQRALSRANAQRSEPIVS